MSPLTIILIYLTIQPLFGSATISTTNSTVFENNNTEIISKIYDERQNGSENVRVNIKDVFFIWAPLSDENTDTDFLDYPNEEVPQESAGSSNEVEKPTSIIDILNSYLQLAASTTTVKPAAIANETGK